MNSRFVYGIASLVLAFVLAFFAIPFVSSRTNGKTTIVRVTQPVLRGEVITADCLEEVEVGAFNLPENVARQTSDVAGLYASVDLMVGDYILGSKVSAVPLGYDLVLSELPNGQVAISVTVKSLASGLSDKLQPEDIVQFFHFLDEARAVPELQYVRVLAVTDGKGLDVEKTETDENGQHASGQAATITVLATHAQAQLLTQLENEGQLHVALVSRGDAAAAEAYLQVQDEYLQHMEELARQEEEELQPADDEELAYGDEPEEG